MAAENFSEEKPQKTFADLNCSTDLTPGLHGQLTFILVLNTSMSVTAFFGNALILIACTAQGVFTSSAVQTLAS